MTYSISEACTGCGACREICPTCAVSPGADVGYAINASACIECGACGRVCPALAVTDSFGIPVDRIPESAWKRPHFDLSLCLSCAICIDACPAGAIAQALQRVGNRHLFPVLEDETRCMACGFCALDCPIGAVVMGPGIATGTGTEAVPAPPRESA